jgi:hypothetical protein
LSATAAATTPTTEPSTMSDTARLFLYMGVFALVTLGVYFACEWMVKIEERRQDRRR